MAVIERKEQSTVAPCLPLKFLLEPHANEVNRRLMPGCSDSAIFFHLWNLFNNLEKPNVIAGLRPDQLESSERFHMLMASLPWQTVVSQPHLKELPDDDLSPLIMAGKELYDVLTLE